MLIKKLKCLFDAWLTGKSLSEEEYLKAKLSQLLRKKSITEGEEPWHYYIENGELRKKSNPNFFQEVNPEDAV
jgi:hypothetical protein